MDSLALALPFVVVSPVLLPAWEREASPTRANVDRQIRPLLEEALDVKLVEATSFSEYGSPPDGGTELWADGVGTNYYVKGRPPGSSQTVNSLMNVVQSLGVQELEAGAVGNTSIVVFEGLSVEGGIWSGFIQVHRQIAGWYLHR